MRGVAFLQIVLAIVLAATYFMLAVPDRDVSAMILAATALSGFGVLRLAGGAQGRGARGALWLALIGGAAAIVLTGVAAWSETLFPSGHSVGEIAASFNAFMRTVILLAWTALIGMAAGWVWWLALWIVARRRQRG